jgi:hypothetical protein
MFTDINRIAELAKEDPKRQFYSIAHLITVGALHEAFRSLRKDARAGIDGVTYEIMRFRQLTCSFRFALHVCFFIISSKRGFGRDPFP